MNKKNINIISIISNLFKKRPNIMATFLVIVILGIMYCYFGSDIQQFCQAIDARAELAEQAQESVLYETGLDMNAIGVKMQSINQSIQDLNNSTDLGEYFASNDLTAEGRRNNERWRIAIVVIIVVLAFYVFMNFSRAIVWGATNLKSAKKAPEPSKGKFQKN